MTCMIKQFYCPARDRVLCLYFGVGGWRGLTFTVTIPSRWSGFVEANAHDVVCSRLEIHLLKFIFWLTNQKNDVLSFVVSSDSNDCSQ